MSAIGLEMDSDKRANLMHRRAQKAEGVLKQIEDQVDLIHRVRGLSESQIYSVIGKLVSDVIGEYRRKNE